MWYWTLPSYTAVSHFFHLTRIPFTVMEVKEEGELGDKRKIHARLPWLMWLISSRIQGSNYWGSLRWQTWLSAPPFYHQCDNFETIYTFSLTHLTLNAVLGKKKSTLFVKIPELWYFHLYDMNNTFSFNVLGILLAPSAMIQLLTTSSDVPHNFLCDKYNNTLLNSSLHPLPPRINWQ